MQNNLHKRLVRNDIQRKALDVVVTGGTIHHAVQNVKNAELDLSVITAGFQGAGVQQRTDIAVAQCTNEKKDWFIELRVYGSNKRVWTFDTSVVKHTLEGLSDAAYDFADATLDELMHSEEDLLGYSWTARLAPFAHLDGNKRIQMHTDAVKRYKYHEEDVLKEALDIYLEGKQTGIEIF